MVVIVAIVVLSAFQLWEECLFVWNYESLVFVKKGFLEYRLSIESLCARSEIIVQRQSHFPLALRVCEQRVHIVVDIVMQSEIY